MNAHDAYTRCTDTMIAALRDPDAHAHGSTLRALRALGCLPKISGRRPTRRGLSVLLLANSGTPRTPGRATCDVCGSSHPTRTDGQIGAHRDETGERCPGGPTFGRGRRRRAPTTTVNMRVPIGVRERVSAIAWALDVSPRDVVCEAIVRTLVGWGASERAERRAWCVPERLDLGKAKPIGDEAWTRANWCLPTRGVERLDKACAKRGVTRTVAIREALSRVLT